MNGPLIRMVIFSVQLFDILYRVQKPIFLFAAWKKKSICKGYEPMGKKTFLNGQRQKSVCLGQKSQKINKGDHNHDESCITDSIYR